MGVTETVRSHYSNEIEKLNVNSGGVQAWINREVGSDLNCDYGLDSNHEV